MQVGFAGRCVRLIRRLVSRVHVGDVLCFSWNVKVQSDYRDKNIPCLARAPYDLRFSIGFLGFPWLSWAF